MFWTNAEGGYFFQKKLDDEFEWLTCTGVGDIEFPGVGDQTPVYCQNPYQSGDFKIVGFIPGDKEAGSYQLTKPLAGTYNFLLEELCRHHGRVNWVTQGNRQDHRNYEIAALLVEATPLRPRITNPVREPDGSTARVSTQLDMTLTYAMMMYPLTMKRQGVSNTADAHGVFFLPKRCASKEYDARLAGEVGIIGLERSAGYLYDAEIKKTENSGATWTATAVDPYAYGGNTAAVMMFSTVNGTRMLVFRSAEIAGAPAESAYSDDMGATWTNVAISTLNNQAVQDAALRGAIVYACGSDGYIWKSSDQGASWSDSEAGVETTQDLNAICFDEDGVGVCVGDGNAFLYLTENSEDWAARTGPAPGINLLSVAMNLQGWVFVGTNDGRMFRSKDMGQNWDEILDHGVGTIPWIEFDHEAMYVGAYIHNTAAPVGSLYRSENGGASWWQVPDMPTNAGLNDGFMVDQNHIYVVGDVQDGTTFIALAEPA